MNNIDCIHAWRDLEFVCPDVYYEYLVKHSRNLNSIKDVIRVDREAKIARFYSKLIVNNFLRKMMAGEVTK